MISMTVVMEGYDTILLGNFWAYPRCEKPHHAPSQRLCTDDGRTVNEKFGSYVNEEDGYVVNATWQSGLNMGSTVGGIFGALFNGWATSKYGYKPVAIGGLFFLNAFIFIVFFAPSKAVLLVGQITCGKCCSTGEQVSGADQIKV